MVIIDRGYDCAQKIQRNPLINFLYLARLLNIKFGTQKSILSILITKKTKFQKGLHLASKNMLSRNKFNERCARH